MQRKFRVLLDWNGVAYRDDDKIVRGFTVDDQVVSISLVKFRQAKGRDITL